MFAQTVPQQVKHEQNVFFYENIAKLQKILTLTLRTELETGEKQTVGFETMTVFIFE